MVVNFTAGGHGGVQLLKSKPGPKTQYIRTDHPPKIPRNSSVTKIAQKWLTKENAVSSIFLDLPSIFLGLEIRTMGFEGVIAVLDPRRNLALDGLDSHGVCY